MRHFVRLALADLQQSLNVGDGQELREPDRYDAFGDLCHSVRLGRLDESEQLGGLSALPIGCQRSSSTRQRCDVPRFRVVSQTA
jgi:hypothetical protein